MASTMLVTVLVGWLMLYAGLRKKKLALRSRRPRH